MRHGFLFPTLLGVGCLFAFSAMAAPAKKTSAASAAETSAFLEAVEKAKGEYDLIEGDGPKCDGGELTRTDDTEPRIQLGARTIFSRFNAPQIIEKGFEKCKAYVITKTSGSTVTETSRTVCPGKRDVIIRSKFEIRGDEIRFDDGESRCVYRKEKAASPKPSIKAGA